MLVVYFEDLSHSLASQVDRIAEFLNVPLTPAKRAAVIEACSFGAMKKQAGSVAAVTLRKGTVGDWRNHMSQAEWERFDGAFDAALDGVGLAEPLRYYQSWEIDGHPPPRDSVTLVRDEEKMNDLVSTPYSHSLPLPLPHSLPPPPSLSLHHRTTTLARGPRSCARRSQTGTSCGTG